MKGIKFNSEMVNAILEGRKSQTRIVLNPQPTYIRNTPFCSSFYDDGHGRCLKSPFGKIGDKLFVKEDFHSRNHYTYSTNNCHKYTNWEEVSAHFMKQHQSRITLEITDIRVERLADISEDDCWQEGGEDMINSTDDLKQCEMAKKLKMCIDDLKPTFATYWNSTNKKHKWEDNLFVWVISFKRA